ncbi:copper resistance CopC family protein [Halobacillus sp. Marseille-Q1614]|uniref:copper resistance CopC family protein n=1 Tax=Halobacillus sp. Marseille-Q1614 TaxID=2709134 RepID=UPI001570A128|nr:copper resistance CopC family protein [Halobacillus sp. Marseille-Q1614]
MKYSYFLFLLIILAFPIKVGAHTYLESSNPETGETVTAKDPVVTLTFDSSVQDLNTITVTDASGNKTTIEEITHSPDNVMEVTLPEELESGDIQLFYSIVGEDGHVMEEEITYTYEGTEEEEAAESEELAEEQAEEQAEESNQETGEEAIDSSQEEESSQSSWLLPVIAVGLLAVAGIAFLVTRKKS